MDKPFEDFPAYIKGVNVAKEANLVCADIKDGQFNYLKDQIRRAASSVILNLAEGSGRWTKRDKINFYRIARASAFECCAVLDLFAAFQLAEKQHLERLKKQFVEIAGNLQALIFSIEKRKF
ncbi:hypothetical protein A2625_04530 [candidate division WOR-1 bacterium RIFCSPHIGHO2_01_FULL_53_15]|uniref:Four helix bundle protein n=1 Tax=candidate division WOR-1 bacterium RIFCSPHIGHO2_01_FULL_53_15 TaxID=1802564 RepID=A0A1F4PZ55_UNCSA|nr:MAG: hypothetical protein A2625_04530 [candidate division WOR-1 bacterium RIFCSPHIGHO2_01_FULL_53_15]OGC10603.1 MAG: hypothetical protein A3D23_03750 [candidate division WOR-1 bacterium RIFCSPHIGHO2_02_FULL_53_26]